MEGPSFFRTASSLAVALVLLMSIALQYSGIPHADAHQEYPFGDIVIEPGWVEEPPLVGELNQIEVRVSRGEEPIRNAFANLAVSIQKGGQDKQLSMLPTEEEGWYSSEIVPSQTGAYSLVFNGQVGNQTIEATIPIEDVDDTRTLEFPPTSGGGGQSQEITEQLGDILSDLTSQIDQTRAAIEDMENSTQESIKASEEANASSDRAYLVAMVGVGLGAAGIVIAVVMSRKSSSQS
jgi:hypothetical protein